MTLFNVMLLMVIILKPHNAQLRSCSIVWCIVNKCKVVFVDNVV